MLFHFIGCGKILFTTGTDPHKEACIYGKREIGRCLICCLERSIFVTEESMGSSIRTRITTKNTSTSAFKILVQLTGQYLLEIHSVCSFLYAFVDCLRKIASWIAVCSALVLILALVLVGCLTALEPGVCDVCLLFRPTRKSSDLVVASTTCKLKKYLMDWINCEHFLLLLFLTSFSSKQAHVCLEFTLQI